MTGTPQHGTTVIDENGFIVYTPVNGSVGFDDFGYQICADGSCYFADLKVEVVHTLIAVDDSNSTAQVPPSTALN